MSNILTPTEAAAVLRCEITDQNMLDLLPLIDDYLQNATGHDWKADAVIDPTAKSAARMLLVRWYEDPGGSAAGNALGFGLRALMVQLKAKALDLSVGGLPNDVFGLIKTNASGEMAVGAKLVLVFNHELDAGATGQVRLTTLGGTAVAATSNLDVTKQVLTVQPEADLAPGTGYMLILDHVTDAYGHALDTTITFWTAD